MIHFNLILILPLFKRCSLNLIQIHLSFLEYFIVISEGISIKIKTFSLDLYSLYNYYFENEFPLSVLFFSKLTINTKFTGPDIISPRKNILIQALDL